MAVITFLGRTANGLWLEPATSGKALIWFASRAEIEIHPRVYESGPSFSSDVYRPILEGEITEWTAPGQRPFRPRNGPASAQRRRWRQIVQGQVQFQYIDARFTEESQLAALDV